MGGNGLSTDIRAKDKVLAIRTIVNQTVVKLAPTVCVKYPDAEEVAANAGERRKRISGMAEYALSHEVYPECVQIVSAATDWFRQRQAEYQSVCMNP